MKCNIIGAGRLGKNIALALAKANYSLVIYNRHYAKALEACMQLGFGQAVAQLEQLPAADVTWIVTQDDAIPAVAEELAQLSFLKPGSFVIHCSGVFTSSLLASLRARGCLVASFHPLKAFKAGYLNPKAFDEIDCVVEGDEPPCQWLEQFFGSLGAYVTYLAAEKKALYHTVACMASNYLITLAACSEQLLAQTDLPISQCRRMLIQLMQGNLNNLNRNEPFSQSLTGPIARGDEATINTHLQALTDRSMRRLYQVLGDATLALTDLSAEQQQRIKKQLET